MHGNSHDDAPADNATGICRVTVDPNEVNVTGAGPHVIDCSTGDLTPVGEVYYLTMPEPFPMGSSDEKPKRPKRTWPGQGDDRARSGRNQNRSGRRRR
jgi:hypothetical protein